MKCDIGVVGLGVMGSNLALNMERHGFCVAGYDIAGPKSKSLSTGHAEGNFILADSPGGLAKSLDKPRRILMMVPAGLTVDTAIASLKIYLEPGDILIDGGNSHFQDTERRAKQLSADHVFFVGAGISGGEYGALWGPSIMPGGQKEAWEDLQAILRAIAAKAEDGEPCVEYMGPGGAGHFVKMVHNGIEYADMQLIAEVYDLLSRGLGLTTNQMQELFAEWNQGELKSYLVEITAAVLAKIDSETGLPLVDVILDEAQQKGTGKWTSQNALDVGAPIPTINAAVESRIISALKPQRVAAARVLQGPAPPRKGGTQRMIDASSAALYASKLTAYAQGMDLLRIASNEYGFGFNLGNIAKIWRAGCIIRARLLGDVMAAFNREAGLENLLLSERFHDALAERQDAWRFFVQTAVGLGIPVPATAASLAYYDAYRSERLPANLTQAQRDYFGAHTYRRTDKPGVFHTDW